MEDQVIRELRVVLEIYVFSIFFSSVTCMMAYILFNPPTPVLQKPQEAWISIRSTSK